MYNPHEHVLHFHSKVVCFFSYANWVLKLDIIYLEKNPWNKIGLKQWIALNIASIYSFNTSKDIYLVVKVMINSEMKFCENMKLNMLKIILIIIGYTLNNFTTHITRLYTSRWWKKLKFQNGKKKSFFEKKIYLFCQCGNWP